MWDAALKRPVRPEVRATATELDPDVAPSVGWRLDDPASKEFEGFGDAYLSLLTDQDWVHRRVESVRVHGEARFRRQISVDVRVPAITVKALRNVCDGQVAVPLVFAQKHVLTAFDLIEGGQSVPMWTRRQNQDAARAVLHAAARVVRAPITPQLNDRFTQLIEAGPNPEAVSAILTEFSRQAPDPFQLELMKWIVRTLDENFILTAEIPPDRGDQRRVFKVAYDEAIKPTASLWTLLGFNPTSLTFDTRSASMPPSYHFELEVPPGLAAVGGHLEVTRPDGAVAVVEEVTIEQESLAHLTARPGPQDTSIGDYKITIDLAPARAGLAFSAAALAAFSYAVLWCGGYFIDHIRDGNVDASAALLLAAPGLLATFIARPGEHALVSRLLRGVRALTILTGVALFFAAGTLLTDWPNRKVTCAWGLALSVEALCTIALSAVALGVAHRTKRPAVTPGQ